MHTSIFKINRKLFYTIYAGISHFLSNLGISVGTLELLTFFIVVKKKTVIIDLLSEGSE